MWIRKNIAYVTVVACWKVMPLKCGTAVQFFIDLNINQTQFSYESQGLSFNFVSLLHIRILMQVKRQGSLTNNIDNDESAQAAVLPGLWKSVISNSTQSRNQH